MKKLFIYYVHQNKAKTNHLLYILPYGCSKLLKCDDLKSVYELKNVDPNEYDEIFVYSPSDNCFGGMLNKRQVELALFVHKIKDVNKTKFFIVSDDIVYMAIYRCIDLIDKRKGEAKKKMIDALKNDFGLEPKDIDNSHIPFRLITSIKNKNVLDKVFYAKRKYLQCKELHYMAISKGTYYAKDLISSQNIFDKKYDLCYYGAYRAPRINEVQKFCDFETCNLFGNNFDKWNCTKAKVDVFAKKPIDQCIQQISNSWASIILGATHFAGSGHLPSRAIEISLAKTVAFVYRPYGKLYDNDFYYVDTREELLEKINLIKNDKELYDKCLKEQADWIESYPTFDNTIYEPYNV